MCVCFLSPLLDPAQCPGPFLPEILPEPSPHARPPGMCVARCDQSLTCFLVDSADALWFVVLDSLVVFIDSLAFLSWRLRMADKCIEHPYVDR